MARWHSQGSHQLVKRDQRAYCRDMLIHQYHRIKLDSAWDFAQEDLPPLKAAATALLKNLETDDDEAKA